jgi:DASS family divalent anion:Na+ symporter
VAIALITLFYFYSHYLFASITARITVMYATFLLIYLDLGVPALVAGLALAIMSNLSASLTNYGINSASIYYSAGYFGTKEWFKVGGVVATCNFILWIVVGGIWWRFLGWW